MNLKVFAVLAHGLVFCMVNLNLSSILSATNTSVYKLAKFLVPILSLLTVTGYTVKDIFTFTKEFINF